MGLWVPKRQAAVVDERGIERREGFRVNEVVGTVGDYIVARLALIEGYGDPSRGML